MDYLLAVRVQTFAGPTHRRLTAVLYAQQDLHAMPQDGTVKITLPLPPNMANSRTHWRVKNKQRKAYFDACDLLSLTWKFEPDAPWKAVLSPTIYCGGRMDMDNAFARCKWPVDWLVRNGYLVNDNPAHLEWEMPRQVVSRKQPYRVEFDIRRVA